MPCSERVKNWQLITTTVFGFNRYLLRTLITVLLVRLGATHQKMEKKVGLGRTFSDAIFRRQLCIRWQTRQEDGAPPVSLRAGVKWFKRGTRPLLSAAPPFPRRGSDDRTRLVVYIKNSARERPATFVTSDEGQPRAFTNAVRVGNARVVSATLLTSSVDVVEKNSGLQPHKPTDPIFITFPTARLTISFGIARGYQFISRNVRLKKTGSSSFFISLSSDGQMKMWGSFSESGNNLESA